MLALDLLTATPLGPASPLSPGTPISPCGSSHTHQCITPDLCMLCSHSAETLAANLKSYSMHWFVSGHESDTYRYTWLSRWPCFSHLSWTALNGEGILHYTPQQSDSEIQRPLSKEAGIAIMFSRKYSEQMLTDASLQRCLSFLNCPFLEDRGSLATRKHWSVMNSHAHVCYLTFHLWGCTTNFHSASYFIFFYIYLKCFH